MPAIFAATKPVAPGATWQSTHFTLACGPSWCAMNSGFITVWHVCPQNADGVHVLDTPVPRQRDDDDVRDREKEDQDGGPPLGGVVEVDARPLGGGRRLARRAPASLQPRTEGNQDEAEQERAGQQQEEDDADVRVGVEAEQIGQEDHEKQRGADRRQHHARHGERTANQPNVAGHSFF